MKKIILSILIIASLKSDAQRIDTVTVTGLVLRADHLSVLIGGTADFRRDSATTKTLMNLRATVAALPSPTWTTNITIPSIRGEVVLQWYAFMKQGMTVSVYENLALAVSNPLNPSTAIKNINNSALQYFIGRIDGGGLDGYLDLRLKGKAIIID